MAMKKKATIGGALPKPAKNTTGATNRTSGYLNSNAAGNKKATPKTSVTKSGMKISISGSTSGGGANSGKSLKPGAMNQSTKFVKSKPATAKKMTPALKAKVEKALTGSRVAKGTLSMVKEAKMLGNLQGPGVAAKKLKEANQSELDRGRTASRAKNILSKYKNK
jgi:hypothetical protein